MTPDAPFPPDGDRSQRPWGWFETLAEGEGYRIKRLWIAPGRRLSLQRHHHRSEQWQILGGEGEVLIAGATSTVRSGDLLTVPLGALHRAGAGAAGLEILEVQRGDWLSEDDIERLADDYGRVEDGSGKDRGGTPPAG